MNTYYLILWPDSQFLMLEDWFDECILCPAQYLNDLYASSAYFVPEHRYNQSGLISAFPDLAFFVELVGPQPIRETKTTNYKDNEYYQLFIDRPDSLNTPDYFELEIWEYDSIPELSIPGLGDLLDYYSFPVEDLYYELLYELQRQIGKYYFDEYPGSLSYYKFMSWLRILEQVKDIFSSKELYALDYAITTYASVCLPEERRKEMRYFIESSESWFSENNLNVQELVTKIYQLDLLIFYELTEIFLNSKVILHCAIDLTYPPIPDFESQLTKIKQKNNYD